MRPAPFIALWAVMAAHAADLPHRIVSISPNVTEMLYGIGAVALYLNTTFSGQTPIYCTKIRHSGEVLYLKPLQNSRL